ncbi:MAG TPA: FG-GAP-like repeat-containing protein [Lacipirellulaceae bacterium]|nr:FG-GAP-like repeat-containing protein [Lacipirellulaceae bacterium]
MAQFSWECVGPAPVDRPAITNVQIVDLDGTGTPVVVVCDAQLQAVLAYRRQEDGSWQEQTLGEHLLAPAHATVVDIDQDGDNDVVVSVMGNLYPDDDVVGSLVLLENDGGKFTPRVLLNDVRRVVDAQPGDFDGDGDIDLAVAVFGYLRGQILWLENLGDGSFRDHQLHSAAGTIHVPVADFDGDGNLDIVAIVSQNDEEIWAFENVGNGTFRPRQLWMSINYDLGSAGLVATDLDGDGDMDLLLPVGDNLEDSYSVPQPYHGCLWLENQGNWNFVAHRIAEFPGAYAAAAADLDADGDVDVALVSMVNRWDDPAAPSLVWLDNDGRQNFTLRSIASDPIMLVTVASGDVNQDGYVDLVAGGLHMYRPFERLGRVSCWLGGPARPSEPPTGLTAAGDKSSPHDVPAEPNWTRVDALTRRELAELYRRTLAQAADGQAHSKTWLELGQALYAFGFFDSAGQCFQKSAVLDPQSSLPRFLLGASLARCGLIPEAVDEFHQALPHAVEPQQSWIWHEIACCWLRLEDARQAEEALVKSGPLPHALAQLVQLRLRAGRIEEAVTPMNELARREPRAIEMFLLNARLAEALGDERLARQSRDRAEYGAHTLPLDPITAMMNDVRKKYGSPRLTSEARGHIAAQRWDAAAAVLTNMATEHAENEVLTLLAGVEFERRRPQRAIELLEAQMDTHGRVPTAMLLLGDAYELAGDLESALQWWESTAELRSSPSLHRRLARAYESQGRIADGRRQRALALEVRGIGQLRHGNPRDAANSLQEATGVDPALPRAWFYLGECRRVLGDASQARAAYGETLNLVPYHGRARAMLKELPE